MVRFRLLKISKLSKHNYTQIRLIITRKFITLFEVKFMTFVILFYDWKLNLPKRHKRSRQRRNRYHYREDIFFHYAHNN